MQIGSSPYSGLFSFHSFPSFMFDSDMDGNMKILLFNRYIKRLEREEKPDIIILGVPGAVQNLSEEFTLGFAMTPYLTFNAVLVDYLILCSFFETSEEFLKMVSTMCEYKFDCPVDCFHISNLAIDMSETSGRKRLTTLAYSSDFVRQKLLEAESGEIQKFNLLEPENQETLFKLIMDKIASDFSMARRTII